MFCKRLLSSVHLIKKRHVRLDTEPFKPLFNQECERYRRFHSPEKYLIRTIPFIVP